MPRATRRKPKPRFRTKRSNGAGKPSGQAFYVVCPLSGHKHPPLAVKVLTGPEWKHFRCPIQGCARGYLTRNKDWDPAYGLSYEQAADAGCAVLEY